jgi:hypothetical protein
MVFVEPGCAGGAGVEPRAGGTNGRAGLAAQHQDVPVLASRTRLHTSISRRQQKVVLIADNRALAADGVAGALQAACGAGQAVGAAGVLARGADVQALACGQQVAQDAGCTLHAGLALHCGAGVAGPGAAQADLVLGVEPGRTGVAALAQLDLQHLASGAAGAEISLVEAGQAGSIAAAADQPRSVRELPRRTYIHRRAAADPIRNSQVASTARPAVSGRSDAGEAGEGAGCALEVGVGLAGGGEGGREGASGAGLGAGAAGLVEGVACRAGGVAGSRVEAGRTAHWAGRASHGAGLPVLPRGTGQQAGTPRSQELVAAGGAEGGRGAGQTLIGAGAAAVGACVRVVELGAGRDAGVAKEVVGHVVGGRAGQTDIAAGAGGTADLAGRAGECVDVGVEAGGAGLQAPVVVVEQAGAGQTVDLRVLAGQTRQRAGLAEAQAGVRVLAGRAGRHTSTPEQEEVGHAGQALGRRLTRVALVCARNAG